jgi:glycerol uptake facilitator-like aquaporin
VDFKLFLFLKNIFLQSALIYFAGQMLGGIFGYALLRAIIPNEYLSNPDAFAVLKPKLPLASSFLMEFFVCFIFITFLSAALDPRNKHLHGKYNKDF